MKGLRGFSIFLGRAFLSLFFLVSALTKVMDWQNSQRGLVSLFCDWHVYLAGMPNLQNLCAALLPWVPAFLIIVILLELIGGLLLLFGYKLRFSALLLIFVLAPMTVLFHQFWFLDGYRHDIQFVMFVKNLAIMGGLLYVANFGEKDKQKAPENNFINSSGFGN